MISAMSAVLFSTFIMFWCWQSKLCWYGGSALIFMLYICNCSCISAYQEWLSPFSASCFDDVSASVDYLCLMNFWNCWILFTVRNYAQVTTGAGPSLLWGSHYFLLVIMHAITRLKGYLNQPSYKPYFMKKSWWYKWFLELEMCALSFNGTNGCISTRKSSTCTCHCCELPHHRTLWWVWFVRSQNWSSLRL